MMSLSIIRYISDYVKYLPIGVLHYLLIECDILLVLVPLIEEKPWLRINARNEREKYENSKWTVVPKSEYNKLPKLEAQVWITIYNLFMDPECRNKYELSEQRKNNLLRLRKYMNELLLDQIPNLSLMLRSLEELAIMNTQTVPLNNPFVVEQIPKVKTALLENNKNKWAEIAQHQRENFFTQSQQSLEEDMKKLSELYGQQIVEGLMEGFKCNKCQKEASKRCSRCKSVWYCSRECQIGDWPEHKAFCQVKTMELQQKQKEKEQQEKQLESNIDIKNIDKQKQPGIKELDTQNNDYENENEQKQNQNTHTQKDQQQEQQQGESKQEEDTQGNLDDLD
ncbi:hypothetical protein PPERSA_07624 [Pseudocohnilembus persalinus]|uniref:MYND-type domain-containing protein n=1 Tax=Pseudocohnilembus persalinus TaxID=266149 RepID=A0A0V0QIJ7_PSEPJ|nr:hypothetical protein PPERSA_07624 [Pseudocohnilembus persalinus]|eukprot:KRX01979.1 hypothetical protein PPERSA_07624 [Pseudocohnilembus persalinus]